MDRGLWSGSGVRSAGRIQLVIGNRAAILVRSVGSQVLCSHTGGVLKRERGHRRREGTQEKKTMSSEEEETEISRKDKKRHENHDGKRQTEKETEREREKAREIM